MLIIVIGSAGQYCVLKREQSNFKSIKYSVPA